MGVTEAELGEKVLLVEGDACRPVPAVVYGHNYDFGGWFDRLPPAGQRAVRRLLVADRWVVLDERHVEEYARWLQLTASWISVLHNAVRIPDTPVRQSGVGRVHAVALGRLGVRKGSYDLIAAVGALDERVRSRLCVTLGGHGEVDEVRAAVAAAGLHETIHVAGWQDPAARDELRCPAQIFVLPSRNGGLPMALLEAMAYGLAPMTTTVGSIGEAVSDRVNGLLVAPGSPSQIAEVLTALVNDERLPARLGAAARSRAGDFRLDRWYERLARLRTDLASKQPALR